MLTRKIKLGHDYYYNFEEDMNYYLYYNWNMKQYILKGPESNVYRKNSW